VLCGRASAALERLADPANDLGAALEMVDRVVAGRGQRTSSKGESSMSPSFRRFANRFAFTRSVSNAPHGQVALKSLLAEVAWLRMLATALLIAPAVATAQQAPRVPVVGVLSTIASTTSQGKLGQEAFEQGLRENGWIPGKTLRIEYRNPEGKLEQLEALARDLVRLRVDVIVARATPAIRAAKKATATISVVMSATGYDPVEEGFVASLARPGGNITGLTLLNQDLLAKQLQLLKEMVPRLSHVGVLGTKYTPLSPMARRNLETAAESLGLKIQLSDVAGVDQLEAAFADMKQARVGGLLVRADPLVLEPNRELVAALARRHALPAMYWLHEYVKAGGLMSYGTDLPSVHRRSAYYVNRILRGTKAADLPVEEPSKFVMAVNLKTARELGLSLPRSILIQANEILQ
jgi:putative ABC transport system substrate-binding protein